MSYVLPTLLLTFAGVALLAEIQAVELNPSFLGKRVFGHPVIEVRFRRDAGEDSAAWLVQDPPRWLAAIDEARASAR